MANTYLVRSEISLLKQHLALEFTKKPFEFDFSMLNRGDAFRIVSCWRVTDFNTPTYFVSFNNSYRINVVKPDLDYQPNFTTSLYFSCCIKFTEGIFPDMILQPKTLTTRVMDFVFHHDVEINTDHDFSRRYMLQASNPDKATSLLITDFFIAVGAINDLHMEVKGDKCLIYFIRPFQEGDGGLLLNVAEKLVLINQGNNSLSTF